jgi:hypothetical protein
MKLHELKTIAESLEHLGWDLIEKKVRANERVLLSQAVLSTIYGPNKIASLELDGKTPLYIADFERWEKTGKTFVTLNTEGKDSLYPLGFLLSDASKEGWVMEKRKDEQGPYWWVTREV